MLNKKLIIALIIALIAIIVVGFVALHFVPTNDLSKTEISGNMTNVTENISLNFTEGPTESVINSTALNETAISNVTKVTNDNNVTSSSNASSDNVDPGDVLHKQTITITGNETGQNAGMEPGTYVMYYTENDGPIKIQKVA